ncbi:MAG: hypothetical protein AAF488_00535 [Planctomycetota bacterium]
MRVFFSTLVFVGLVVSASQLNAQSLFVRGDANGDGMVDLGDAIVSLDALFGGAIVPCPAALDVDDSGALTIGDPIVLLSFLFSAASPPLPPFPNCGADPTPDGLGCVGPVANCTPTIVIGSPVDGAQLGTAFVDVRGEVGATTGVSVFVNGVEAEVSGNVFVAANVPLGGGSNILVAEATGAVIGTTEIQVTQTVLSSNNVDLGAGRAYAARGGAGIAVVSLETREFTSLPPAPGTGSVDDLEVSDGFLFALDASPPGALSVYSLADPDSPQLVAGPVSVAVGPFAGVSASGGRVTVSGGTSLLSVRSYGSDGSLSTSTSVADLGIGQPDVLQSADGGFAFVSTDFAPPVGGGGFGVTVLDLTDPPGPLAIVDTIAIPGAGFTPGFAGPANFPIESALLPNDVIVTAHGGGLSVVDVIAGTILTALPLGFSAVNIDTEASTAFVVGAGRRFAEVELTTVTSPQVVSNQILAGPGSFTGVAANSQFVAIAANDGGLVILSR